MNKNPQATDEILEWINTGCEFHSGCALYHKYGTNIILKTQNFIPSKRFPAIENHLKKELSLIAGLNFDPLNPSDLKKKHLEQPLTEVKLPKVEDEIVPNPEDKIMPKVEDEIMPIIEDKITPILEVQQDTSLLKTPKKKTKKPASKTKGS